MTAGASRRLIQQVVRTAHAAHHTRATLIFTRAASSSSYKDTFRFDDLRVREATGSERHAIPDPEKLLFGHHYSDHMLEIEWTENKGWGMPQISPIHNLSLHPGAKVFHYAIELFEGIKAFRGVDNKIRIFRPDMNMKRMHRTAKRACLPVCIGFVMQTHKLQGFDCDELLKCMTELVRIDADWVPATTSSSLYIRPTFIGTDPTLGISHSRQALLFVILGPVGAYYPTGFQPIGLLADSRFVRAAIGGTGNYKLGCNYAPTILIAKEASTLGAQQVLWLYGDDEKLTEVGTMNIFTFITNENGEKELITPPLDDGIILPGVTRDSLLTLAREWGEFKVSERYPTMAELCACVDEGRMHEVFGAGTACIVCPVDKIIYKKRDGTTRTLQIPTMQQRPKPLMQRFFDAITDIQYGRVSRPDWQHVVC